MPGNSPAAADDTAVDVLFDDAATRTKLAVKRSRLPDFSQLLVHLDRLFEPLMAQARVRPVPQGVAGPQPEPEMARMLPPELPIAGPSAQELDARDAFLAELASDPSPLQVVPGNVGAALRPGPGAPVFIGFDAEWNEAREGRNEILSVQFHLVGPNGEVLSKVIDIVGGEVIESRPALRETLCDLLEEAEDADVFEEWPSEVILCGFFTLADITVFRDFKEFRGQLRGINGTLATVGDPAQFNLPMSESRALRLKARYAYALNDPFDPRLLSVRIIDASRLAPPGKSVTTLGDWLGIPKLTLPAGYAKKDMRRLQREQPEFFRAYGLRDAEIAVMYVLWVLWFCERYLGLKGLSATASGISVRLIEQCMLRDGVHPDVALNYEYMRDWHWDEGSGRPISRKRRVPSRLRRWFEALLSDAYLGGRNEAYWFGPTPRPAGAQPFYDHDLAACYVMSLVGPMALDYERIEIVRDVSQLCGHVAGYAEVTFEFPPEIARPCLPVVMEKYGLWFPRKGVSLATAPEIELAHEMGAKLDVRFGIVIPWKDRAKVFADSAARLGRRQRRNKHEKASNIDPAGGGEACVLSPQMQFPPPDRGDAGYRPFESSSIYTRLMRLEFARKSLPHEFMKLVGNGGYGKTGQGCKGRNGFSPETLASVPIGLSRITEPAIAALVSGFARAVLSEILWKLPADALLVSATTDGLLVNTDQLDLSGTMCRHFQALVDRVAPGTSMTEVKHVIAQAVAGKTRLQLTGLAINGEDPVVAKGGVKIPLDLAEGDEEREKWLMSPAGQNAYMLDLFSNRVPHQTIVRPSLMSMRDMLIKDWDLQTVNSVVRLNLEYDHKRCLVNPRMVRIESTGIEHLACDTVPWDTVEEGELARVVFDEWRRGRAGKDGEVIRPGNCLKTLEDWNAWQAFYTLRAGNRERRRRHEVRREHDDFEQSETSDNGNGGSPASRGKTGMLYATEKTSEVGIARRLFLAAYVQRAWGLENVDLSQAKLAEWLTQMGFPTKLHDVKNAGRSHLHEYVLPPIPDVQAFLAVVKQRFPGLEVERFLSGAISAGA